jgi:hypothetical protein
VKKTTRYRSADIGSQLNKYKCKAIACLTGGLIQKKTPTPIQIASAEAILKTLYLFEGNQEL